MATNHFVASNQMPSSYLSPLWSNNRSSQYPFGLLIMSFHITINRFKLIHYFLKILCPSHGVVTIHVGFLDHGLGHELQDIGEAA